MKQFLICFLVVTAWFTPSHADFELSPLRTVIDSKSRVSTFTMSNPSARVISGSINWIDLTFTENGIEPASPSERTARSAAPYLIVSPATFQLEPGGRLDVRVELKKGARIPRGERRSHLLFETSASRTTLHKASESGLQIDIGLSVSVPVLLRGHGRPGARIGETQLVRDDDGFLALSTQLEQSGGHSAYGRLLVYHTPKQGTAAPSLLGEIANVAAYKGEAPKNYLIPLNKIALEEGSLELRYEGGQEHEGRMFDLRVFGVATAD